MRVVRGAPIVSRLTILWVMAGCAPQETVRAPDIALPPAGTTAVALTNAGRGTAISGGFVGAYQGSLGFVWFEQQNGALVGRGPRMTIRCNGTAELDCTWKEDASSGWAKLRMEGTGDIRGEWGEDGEKTASGSWIFVRVGAQADEHFDGEYDSEYGDAKFTQQGHDVHVTYPNGTLSCVVEGPHLDCAWDESGTTGRALLTRQPNGNIVGTWGDGASNTDGGTWVFKRR